MAKSPLELANQIIEEESYVPFKLDKAKYPDVEETPYGFIYNVNGKSITDVGEQNRKLFNKEPNPAYQPGFTVTDDFGDEVSLHDFDTAYKFAKGLIKNWKGNK